MGDEARARREKIRSIGHGSVIDDYIFDRQYWRSDRTPPSVDMSAFVPELCHSERVKYIGIGQLRTEESMAKPFTLSP